MGKIFRFLQQPDHTLPAGIPDADDDLVVGLFPERQRASQNRFPLRGDFNRPLAAVLALAIPYGGILGRIYSELLQDVPEEPLRALRSAGASEWRVMLYGRLPMALPDMLSYTFYRFECGIPAAACRKRSCRPTRCSWLCAR